MIVVGQCCLLIALVAAGYASCECFLGARARDRRSAFKATFAAALCVVALTVVMLVLAWALVAKDFHFAYVAEYSSRLLPWQYSLSALWVGQAGSLLLWTWLLGILALAFRLLRGGQDRGLHLRALGVLMAYTCFLVATMVFAADPMKVSLTSQEEGAGLSPLLQHPAMLIHPPVVFLGYAAWAIPFALAVAALFDRQVDGRWIRQARSWTVFAWVVLGMGIILGGNWAYEELGWGGYWAWDPVENGSLIPWLTGTALIHCLMAWQYRGMMKKTAFGLAVATFTLCNFASFLTRSGIFSSLHAFSRSSIGWMFLGVMIFTSIAGALVIAWRRSALAPDRPMMGIWTREALIFIANIGLVLLATVAFVGTLTVPLTDIFIGDKIVVGLAFYNNVLIPIGLLLLATSAASPLLRWGTVPSGSQRRMLAIAAAAGLATGILTLLAGERNVVSITVFSCASFAAFAFLAAVLIDVKRRDSAHFIARIPRTLLVRRQQYAGYLMHLGFACLAVGIAGSSLGSLRREVVMREGETIAWSGYSIHLAKTREQALPDKLIGDVQLEIARGDQHVCTLFPAQHLHRLQEEWTTEVAIHSTWTRDFYAILHGAAGEKQAELTFVINPLVRWIWLGGWLFAFAFAIRLWPASQRRAQLPLEVDAGVEHRSTVPGPTSRRRHSELVKT